MTRPEIFKPVTNFEHYHISNFARLLNTRTGKFIKPVPNGHYLKVLLCDNGRTWQTKLHILVARHHVPNPDPVNKTWVNHLCPKLTRTVAGNAAHLLEFVSPKENSAFITVSKFFTWDDSAQPQAEQEQTSTCLYCHHPYDDLFCSNCTSQGSSPRSEYQRATGGSFF